MNNLPLLSIILKEAYWIGKFAQDIQEPQENWLEKVIDHKTPTGQTRKIKVKSLPWEERIKYAPANIQKQLQDQGKPNKGRPKKDELKIKLKEKELDLKDKQPEDIKTELKQKQIEVDKTIHKPISEMTDDEILDKYIPKFSGSEYQKKMSSEEIDELASNNKLSTDDVAYHLLNSNVSYEFKQKTVRNYIGWGETGFLGILNKNNSIEQRTSTAKWLIDKGGVSFVAGKSMLDFIRVAANKGYVSKELLKDIENEKNIKKTYYAGLSTPNELRQFDVNEYAYQLINNKDTPSDVLQKIINNDKELQHGLEIVKKEGFDIYDKKDDEWGSKTKRQREDDNAVSEIKRILEHPNFPYEQLKNIKGFSLDNKFCFKILLKRKDIPETDQAPIVQKLIDNLSKTTIYMGSLEYTHPEFPNFKLKEDDFNKIWQQAKENDANSKRDDTDKTNYATSTEYELERIAKRDECPDNVLKEVLNWQNRKTNKETGREPAGTYLRPISDAKKIAYNKLAQKGKISDDEIVKRCADKLNLHGDVDLLKKIGETAFTVEESTNQTPRTFAKVSDEEKKKIEEQLRKTAFHEDFDFDLVGAWEVDKPPHKDFDKTAKKIGNVKSELYHGTSFANAGGILSDGIKAVTKARTGQMMGQGFYLASTSSKAVQYASDNFSKEDGSEGIVFMLDAALGKSKEFKYGRPADDDQVADDDEMLKRVEKYNKKHGYKCETRWHLDNDSVTAKAGMSLDYDEYVIKDASQVKINRILHVLKKPKVK